MPTPKTRTGVLTTAQTAIYRVPKGRYAVVTALVFINSSGSTRAFAAHIRTPDGGSGVVARRSLSPITGSTNDFSLGSERWVLEQDVTIEANQDAGTDVRWTLTVLEFDTP